MVSKTLIRISFILIWLSIIAGFVSGVFSNLFTGEKRSINIAAWVGSFDMHQIKKFEKETGIAVNVSFYESNEELYLKLGAGYDLIIPSDYAVQYLREKGLLKKLNKRKLTFYNQLNPLLLGHYFDPRNEYSIPFEWAIMGLGINTFCYPEGIKDDSLSLIFEKKYTGEKKILMTNDPLVGVSTAALYLFGRITNLTKDHYKKIQQLLHRQHDWVAAYTDFRAHYALSSKNGCIALASSSYILKSMREYNHIEFIIPKEGSILTIENFALPKATKKDDLIYTFLNFIMRSGSVVHTFEHLGFFPATLDVLNTLKLQPEVKALLTMSKKDFRRFHLLRYDLLNKVMSPQELQDLWVRVKV